MCWTVTSRVASFTFPTTSSSQPIAGAAGTLRCAAARAVGGIAVKQAASIAFDDSRHTRASAGRRILFPAALRVSRGQRRNPCPECAARPWLGALSGARSGALNVVIWGLQQHRLVPRPRSTPWVMAVAGRVVPERRANRS